MLKNIFDIKVCNEQIRRINSLQPESQPLWGKMSVDQMLAHCNVTYEFVYTNKHPKPNRIKKFFIQTFVKKIVVGEQPYAKNTRTAPEFIMSNRKDFDHEKKRLIEYISKTQAHGKDYFDGKESHAMGNLTWQEWNNMFYKHLDHHLQQFGV